jgi:hypothetical protein
VPPAIGKFIICAAKMNAEIIPIRGMDLSSNSLLDLRSDIVNAPALTIAAGTQTSVDKNPSGICILFLQ